MTDKMKAFIGKLGLWFRKLEGRVWILWHICSMQELWSDSKQAVTKQRPVNNSRGILFSAQSMPMAAYAAMKYFMPLQSNNCTATEEQCFLCRLYWVYIMS
jgi:hypothetical protein